MTIIEMLRKEASEIENNPSYANFIRTDATDIMISIKFADDTYHHIMPNKRISGVLTQELQRMVEFPIYWDETVAKHAASNLPDFVGEEEMEI